MSAVKEAKKQKKSVTDFKLQSSFEKKDTIDTGKVEKGDEYGYKKVKEYLNEAKKTALVKIISAPENGTVRVGAVKRLERFGIEYLLKRGYEIEQVED